MPPRPAMTRRRRPKSSQSNLDMEDDDVYVGMMGSRTRMVDGSSENDTPEDQPKGCINSFVRGFKSLWVTRTILDENDKEQLVGTTLRELIVYVVFLAVLCIVAMGMLSPTMFYYTKVLSELFVDNNLADSSSTFREIASQEDVWRFAEGPLADGLYWEKWYNGGNMTKDLYGYIYYENKMLGVPRIRQLKVRNDSCKIPNDFKDGITRCYGEYSGGIEDKEEFGPGPNSTLFTSMQAWRYNTEKELDGSSHSGVISKYGGGGFVQNLGKTRAEFDAVISELKDNLWLRRGTRAVFFDFTLYNGNINLFCVVRMLIELPATGGAFSSFNFRTVKLIRYVTGKDYFIMACECLFALYIIYYFIEEAIEIKKHKISYFKNPWNVQDVLLLLISIVCMGFNVYRTMSVSKKLDSLLEKPDDYPDFEFLSYWEVQFSSAMAILVLLAWVKLFKYISFNKTMNQLSATLAQGASDLAGFLVMFLMVFFAFCQLGYLLFGHTLADFASFSSCVFTLFRIMLGDFDFNGLQSADRILGPLYFILYVFFVFFVLLNMFLAIVGDAYADMKEDLDNQKNDFEVEDYFKKGYNQVLDKFNLKRDKIVDIQHAIAMADRNGDNQLDFDEWRSELKGRGYAEAEIEAVFAKYDIDGNRTLNADEQQTMMDDLNTDKEACDNLVDLQENSPREGGESSDNLTEIPKDEFSALCTRVDRMELSIGTIVSKIDAVLIKLDAVEKSKTKRREAMSKILDGITQASGVSTEMKQEQMRKLVRDELERLDSESSSSLGGSSARSLGGSSRASSARSRPSSASGSSEF